MRPQLAGLSGFNDFPSDFQEIWLGWKTSPQKAGILGSDQAPWNCVLNRNYFEAQEGFVVKDYFAIIGVMAAITAASVFAAWSAFSEVEKSGDDLEVAGLQPISVPASDLPEANGADLKKKLQGSKKAMGTKPVITIEEIDPGDGRSIMSDHAKNGSMKKGMDKRNANISTKADRKNGKPDRASKESENFNPASPDSDDQESFLDQGPSLLSLEVKRRFPNRWSCSMPKWDCLEAS